MSWECLGEEPRKAKLPVALQKQQYERNTMSAHNRSKKAKETASFDLVFQNLNHAERFHLGEAIINVQK